MKPNKVSLQNLTELNTSHFGIVKRIYFTATDFESNITQVAITTLNAGQNVNLHKHESMEEVFYIVDGECLFTINQELIIAQTSDCIKIPAQTLHSISAKKDCTLFYFGVSV